MKQDWAFIQCIENATHSISATRPKAPIVEAAAVVVVLLVVHDVVVRPMMLVHVARATKLCS